MQMPAAAYTQACEDRDFVEWHRGCPWCAVWVLRLDVPQVQSLLDSARARIGAYLLPGYERQAHVTLAYRGLMSGAQGHAHAEYASADLQRDIALLQAAKPPEMMVTLAGSGSFTTVPYVSVADDGSLQRLHKAMQLQSPDPDWHYVPHVTLGHYARQEPMSQVMQQLASALAEGVLWQMQISEIWLARYRTQDIAGPLFWEGRFDVRTGMYEAQRDAYIQLD